MIPLQTILLPMKCIIELKETTDRRVVKSSTTRVRKVFTSFCISQHVLYIYGLQSLRLENEGDKDKE